jgi:hypothetical protein
MAEQRIGQMDAEQVRQRRIGAVEIHPRRIRREQSRLIGWNCHIVVLAWLVHWQPLFVPSLLNRCLKTSLLSLTCRME